MIEVNEDSIPIELRERKQWVLWKNFKRGNGKPTKVPCRIDGGPAKTNDATTWATFDEVLAAYKLGGYAGIGYVFTEDDPFVGIDLDACYNSETGEIATWTKGIIDKLDSYSEVSPSGSGIKIFVRGKSPFSNGKNKELPQYGNIGDKGASIEIYDKGRYFALTGRRIEQEGRPLNGITSPDLSFLQREFWPETVVQAPPVSPTATSAVGSTPPQQRPWEPPAESPAPWGPSTGQPAPQPSVEPAPPQAPATAPASTTGLTVLQRASLYLATVDPAIWGQNGHARLLWACTTMVHGFLLSNEQALDLLEREYNGRCQPPWNMGDPAEAKDFRRKVEEARKLTPDKPRGWLLEDNTYSSAPIDPVTTAAIEQLIENSQVAHQDDIASLAVVQETSDPNELEFLIHPPGLLGEMCEWIDGTALRYQPFLTLACTLTFLGTLFGRKIKDFLGSRTNLYCMGVAGSSAGKDHAPDQIRLLASATGCIDLLGGSEVTSDAAIESRLEKNPATLYLWDEIGHKFIDLQARRNPHRVKIVPLLMELYSRAKSVFIVKDYADADRQKVVIQPCLSIYGTSSPERFTEGISREELTDGWLSRCMVFITNTEPGKNRSSCNAPIPEGILEKVKAWHARQIGKESSTDISQFAIYNEATGVTSEQPPEQLLVLTTPEAEKLFIALDRESDACRKHNSDMACLWAKAEENARRIALIIAAGVEYESPEITASIADYACRLIRYLLLDFKREIAPKIVDGQIEKDKNRLVRVIQEGGAKGVARSKVLTRTRNLDGKRRDNLLTDLVAAEEIVRATVGPKGGVFFWTPKHFLMWVKRNPEDFAALKHQLQQQQNRK